MTIPLPPPPPKKNATIQAFNVWGSFKVCHVKINPFIDGGPRQSIHQLIICKLTLSKVPDFIQKTGFEM